VTWRQFGPIVCTEMSRWRFAAAPPDQGIRFWNPDGVLTWGGPAGESDGPQESRIWFVAIAVSGRSVLKLPGMGHQCRRRQ
jgi:hypothetical protein